MKVNNSCEATCGARSSRCLNGGLLVLHGGQPAPATPICSQHPQNPSSGGIHPSSPGPLWSPYQLSQGPAPPRIFVRSFQKLRWSSRFLLFSSELVFLLCNFWSKIFKRGISQKWFQINWKHSTFYSGSIANQFSVSLLTLALRVYCSFDKPEKFGETQGECSLWTTMAPFTWAKDTISNYEHWSVHYLLKSIEKTEKCIKIGAK